MQGEEKNLPQWQFKPDAPETTDSKFVEPQPVDHSADRSIVWNASEFIAHQKNIGWFMGLGVVAAVACLAVYLLTQDTISAGMIIVVAIAFAIFAARQPRVLQYKVNESGIHIGDKFYPYGSFKSFSIIEEGVIHSISLLPLKRLMPMITMYYEPTDEHKITDILSHYLPFEPREQDPIDRFMRKIRF